MLYAEYKGEEVWASEFPKEIANINTCKDGLPHYPKCPECGKRVTHRSQGVDGTPANFAHCNWSGSEGGGNGDSYCSGVSVGESQEHKAMKNIAASAVAFALDGIGIKNTKLEVDIAANYSDADWRTVDCLIEFKQRDEQLGEGLIVEVQYKNKAKDKEVVTLDYLNVNQDYSVLWLSQQDFKTAADHPKDWSCRVTHEDAVRKRVREQLWPVGEDESIWSVTPDRYTSNGSKPQQKGLVSSANATVHKTAEIHIDEVRRAGDATFLPKPKLAGTCIDEIAQDYKEDLNWNALFRGEMAQKYINEVGQNNNETEPLPYPKLAGTAVDGIAKKYKQTVEWSKLFTEPKTHQFIQEVQIWAGKPIRDVCPKCSRTHELREIKSGEKVRGKTCRNCGAWFTVFDRDAWISGAEQRNLSLWMEVVANA